MLDVHIICSINGEYGRDGWIASENCST